MSHETYADDGPSPQMLESATDTRFGRDWAVLVQSFRTKLERKLPAPELRPGSELLAKVSYVLATGDALADEQYLVGFADDYGIPPTLRALATAVEQHTTHTPRPRG